MHHGSAFLSACLAPCFAAGAQSPPCGQPEPLSRAGGFDGVPLAQAVYDEDGAGPAPARLFVGGRFSRAGVVAVLNLARWDGAAWSPVGATPRLAEIRALRVFDDGRSLALYAAGSASEQGGARLHRWDGADWSSLPVPALSGVDPHRVDEMVVMDPDGPGAAGVQLHVAASYFDPVTTCEGLAVHRYDGQGWTQVGAMLPGDTVNDLRAYDPDGSGPRAQELYAATSIGTTHGCASPERHIFHFSQGDWNSISTAGYAEGIYLTMAVYDDDGPGPRAPRLHVGGHFDLIGPPGGRVAAANVAAWDGDRWEAVGGGVTGPYVEVISLATFDPDGPGPQPQVLVAGGTFDVAGGTQFGFVSAWDGAAWAPITPGLSGTLNWRQTMTLREFDEDGPGPGTPALFIGGGFTGIGGLAADHWAAWRSGAMTQVADGPSGPIRALSIFNDGSPGGRKLFAAGSFARTASGPASNIARWDGSTWSPLGAGIQGQAVNALAGHNDGSGWALYAGGTFTSAGGQPARNIARWNGQAWARIGASGLDGGPVYALEVHDADGAGPRPPQLVTAGAFTSADGQPVSRIAAWDGTAWAPIGAGLQGTVHALRSFDDGGGAALYAAGAPLLGPGTLVAKWNGAAWTALPPLSNGPIVALAIHDAGEGPRLFAGGNTAAGSTLTERFVLGLIGGSWRGLGSYPPGPPAVPLALRSAAEGSGRSLYLGTEDASRYLARHDGAWSSPSPAVRSPVRALSAPFDDSHGLWLFIGGDFTRIGDDSATHVARIRLCPPGACFANCDGSSTPPILNVNDFVCFQTSFAAGAPYADCDQSGILNVTDFVCFQARFAAGCR